MEQLEKTGTALDGQERTLYGHVTVPYKPKDSRGTVKEMFQTFYTADVAHCGVLLGRDWLAQVEPDTRWGEAKWYFRDTAATSIEELSAEQLEEEVLESPSGMVYALYWEPSSFVRRSGKARMKAYGLEVEPTSIPESYLDQCWAIRNGRMFCIIKWRIKHVFYNKKRGKKRDMKCR